MQKLSLGTGLEYAFHAAAPQEQIPPAAASLTSAAAPDCSYTRLLGPAHCGNHASQHWDGSREPLAEV